MNKQQIIVVSSIVILFVVLFWGCPKKGIQQATIDRSRALSSTDVLAANAESSLVTTSKQSLDADKVKQLIVLDKALAEANGNEATIKALESLAHFWYETGNAAVSGEYAEKIATKLNTEEAWMTAGSTYYIGIQQATENETLKKACFDKATKAIENAISINPENVNNRINLALCYVECPLQENPMQGILMLRDLDAKYPNNPSVLFNLGRLAIRTGQWQKAIDRLEKVVSLTPENAKAYCLLAEAYNGIGDAAKASAVAAKCKAN